MNDIKTIIAQFWADSFLDYREDLGAKESASLADSDTALFMERVKSGLFDMEESFE